MLFPSEHIHSQNICSLHYPAFLENDSQWDLRDRSLLGLQRQKTEKGKEFPGSLKIIITFLSNQGSMYSFSEGISKFALTIGHYYI